MAEGVGNVINEAGVDIPRKDKEMISAVPAFISGSELNRRLFEEIERPILHTAHPELQYPAALIGPGSESLGFDTQMSVDYDVVCDRDLRGSGSLEVLTSCDSGLDRVAIYFTLYKHEIIYVISKLISVLRLG
jgi:hypothetical protein